MDFLALVGLVSGITGIIGFVIPDKFKSNKVYLGVLLALITLISGVVINYNSELARIKRVGRVASALLKERQFNFTNEGYIQAGLTFLEQNKDVYPDAYERAKAIDIKLKTDDDKYSRSMEAIGYASQIDGILQGVVILNTEISEPEKGD